MTIGPTLDNTWGAALIGLVASSMWVLRAYFLIFNGRGSTVLLIEYMELQPSNCACPCRRPKICSWASLDTSTSRSIHMIAANSSYLWVEVILSTQKIDVMIISSGAGVERLVLSHSFRLRKNIWHMSRIIDTISLILVCNAVYGYCEYSWLGAVHIFVISIV